MKDVEKYEELEQKNKGTTFKEVKKEESPKVEAQKKTESLSEKK